MFWFLLGDYYHTWCLTGGITTSKGSLTRRQQRGSGERHSNASTSTATHPRATAKVDTADTAATADADTSTTTTTATDNVDERRRWRTLRTRCQRADTWMTH